MTPSPAVLADGGGNLEVATIDVGEPGPGEVLVRLHASGVCHTDADICASATEPLVLGHEGAGEVIAVGPGVKSAVVGSRVLLTWAISCGACDQCRRGDKVLCSRLGPGPNGHARPAATTHEGAPLRRAFNLGTMSTLTVVREQAVVPLLDGIPYSSACLLGCAVMTGFGSVVNVGAVKAGDSVVVLGVGGVGLNVVQAARLMGAAPIIAVDVDAGKLEEARRFGATHSVKVSPGDLDLRTAADAVWQMNAGAGADFAFECTAVPRLALAPLRMIRNGGTAIAVSGVEEEITADMRLFEWDKRYINPLYGHCDPAVDFPRLQKLYLAGDLMLDELVREQYPLDCAAAAFADLSRGLNGRGVVIMP